MKTKIYFLASLVLSMQLISTGQTNGIQSEFQNNQTTSTNTSKKDAAVLITNRTEEQKKILPILGSKENSGKKTEISTVNSNNIQNLIHRSDELLAEAQSFRTLSKNQTNSKNNTYIEKARNFEKEALSLQLQAYELQAILNFQTYYHNKLSIKLLVSNFNGEKNTLVLTYELILESEQEMKIAQELREEAYAQPNLASKIGSLGNAEEKESIALHKQNIALTTLAKATSITNNSR